MAGMRGDRSELTFFGVCAGFVALFMGLGLLILLTTQEESVRDQLRQRAEAVIETVYREGGREAAKATTDGSWILLNRAQERYVSLGVATLVLATLSTLFGRRGLLARVGGIGFGIGAILVPSHAFVSGLLAPALGSTAVALDRSQWIVTTGSCLLAVSALAVMIDVVTGRNAAASIARTKTQEQPFAATLLPPV